MQPRFEQCGRLQMQRQRPRSDGRHGDQRGDTQCLGVVAGAPCRADQRQRERDQYHDHGVQYALRQKHHADGRAEQQSAGHCASRRERHCVIAQGKSRQRCDVGNDLMTAQHQTKAAEHQQRGNRAFAASVEFARSHAAEQ